ncbi:RNA polymerase sigma factor [Actinoallomurus liliacearum]|uniref:RNA polymerase sigma factor n=1 Tax=Actinoallomurus liliacearum TaxID=1080073 RepID=A0ABP8TCV6_9ACTN
MAEPETGLSHIRHDPEAFEAFYRRHVETVNRFVARRVDDPHTAADLTAEVFMAVIDSAHTYRPSRGNEIAWLFGVARNVLAADRRRAGREQRANGRIAGRRLLDSDDIDRLVERIDAESAGRRTYEALADLPGGVRALLELIAVDGLTVTEAAAALGIRPVTARVRLHRARKVLRDAVSAQSPAMAYAEE